MKIRIARHIGFCFGVRRAVNIAQRALKRDGEFFCLGPLIHNPQEVKRLSEKGLKIVKNVKDIERGATLIIRSHGLLPTLIKTAGRRGIKLIDATCPFVKKAQGLCRMLEKKGFSVIVIGDKRHPEVKALVGFAGGQASVVENIRDLNKLRLKNKKIGVVAQTTQSKKDFQKLVRELLKRRMGKDSFAEIRIFDTICADSAARQASARKISCVCDAMLVVGGRNSANSRRLAKICRQKLAGTHHIETSVDIKPRWKKVDCIGVVSGASTPDWVIKDVIKNLRTRRNKTRYVG